MTIEAVSFSLSKSSLEIEADRKQFNKEIRLFKKTYQIKLKNLFEGENSKTIQIRNKFWENTIISKYFARTCHSINFTDYHPILHTKREEKDCNDYYESRIYQLAKEHNQPFLPYRGDCLTDNFYKVGTSRKDPIACLFNRETEVKDVHIMLPKDIYGITKKLTKLQFRSIHNSFRFVLSPNYKDSHASTLVTILEKDTSKILASIHINSFDSDEYYRYIHCRFKLTRENWNMVGKYYNEKQIPHYLDEMYQNFKKDTSKELIVVEEESKTTYVFSNFGRYNTTPEVEKIEDDFKYGKIKTVHRLEGDTKSGLTHYFCDRRHAPFLNASHHLQLEEDDKNCTHYTNNFISAISKLMESPAAADRIYNLALQINNENEGKQVDAQLALVKIFQEEVKAYLPFYYDEKGEPKEKESIHKFHLQQRWELGSLAATSVSYLSKVGFLT